MQRIDDLPRMTAGKIAVKRLQERQPRFVRLGRKASRAGKIGNLEVAPGICVADVERRKLRAKKAGPDFVDRGRGSNRDELWKVGGGVSTLVGDQRAKRG